ncbi:putative inorganic phosphate cotransporter isoform X2 [Parasteatoda tepidariorum]|uniref:putative inorganic phosphate cotransporter isoform X1 n=1 Tax=Parasteatoda tepidariorum TaxID=114398 RepID=UPI001C719148|nr:putative inorganic phosphate cotransporter isoform X1 [Parasteatoda tepidariorum]XP_042911037.1 putative inorganic phosphate cotransporter isoform X2 [Parasteatoda tepidariorum]
MIPARFVLTILGFFGYINLYAMRVNLSVAMVAMVGKTHTDNGTNETVITCPELIIPKNLTNENDIETFGEFDWDSSIQGQVIGSYFYGYILTQLPAGILAEMYGAKWIYGIGILMTSLLTFLTPLAARWNVWALVVLRAAIGLSGGVAFPAMNVLISRWVPKMERSRISTAMNLGTMLGTLATNMVTGILSESSFLGGWPSVFYLCGLMGSVWFILWALLIHETPDDHPTISKEELIYIQEGLDQAKSKGMKIPWKSIWTSLPMWAVIVAHFGQNWAFYTLLTMMPTYLSNVLHFDLKDNGMVSGIPFLMMALFAFPASIVADYLRAGDYLRVTTIRKIMNSIAFFGPALCAVAIAFVGCRPIIIIVLFSLSFGLNGLLYSSFMVNHVDMSPKFAGTLLGITNAIATLPGFLAPAFVGVILKSGQTLRNWAFVYISSAIIHFLCGLFYDIFASAELQPWNEENEKKETEKKNTTFSDEYVYRSKL